MSRLNGLRSHGVVLMFAGLLATAGAVTVPLTTSASSDEIIVHPGESIQAAVDRADPGDTVKVLEGTYHQQVNISTDDITLKGEGPGDTVIAPPNCSGSCATTHGPAAGGNCDQVLGQTGICIGVAPIHEGSPPTRVVDGVVVKSLTVSGFAGAGIFAAGTDEGRVENVHATSNGVYGIYFNESTDATIQDNLTTGSSEAGIYFGDSPAPTTVWSPSEISGNTSLNNGKGLLLRDASHGVVEGNTAQSNCVGIFFLNTGYGQGLANNHDWKAENNDVDKNDLGCPGGDTGPALSGIGILVAGATHITVSDNSVEDNNPGANQSIGSGGILLVSTAGFGGTDENNNTVKDNEAENNVPVDIFWDKAGTGNTFSDNDCDASQPSGFC